MSLLSDLILENSPIAYWKLDESSGIVALDSSGLGNNATYNGTVQLGQYPLIGAPDAEEKSVLLNGNGAVVVNTTSGFDTSSPFSFFGVVKRTTKAFYQVLFWKGDSAVGGQQGIGIYSEQNSDAIRINYFNGGWFQKDLGSLPGNIANKFTIGLSYEGGTTLKACVNGALSTINLDAPLPNASSQTVSIGSSREYGSYVNKFYGSLDEIAWFNSAKTSLLQYLHDASFVTKTVSGFVKNSAENGVARTLRIYDRASGRLVGSTVSSAFDGNYSIQVPIEAEVQVIMLDDDLGTLENDLILRTTPT